MGNKGSIIINRSSRGQSGWGGFLKVSSSSKAAETDEGEQKKLVASQLLTEAPEPLSRPEASRVSLDSRIVKWKMLHSPETSRLSSDHADKRAKAFV
ncbi:hypothetical protein KSP40_PGU013182 [Platanthera guangdongensis]|uniref:Uncharacterized protein n=1 Tax=Platanthera guangdongensis TaxID=2320717 RepID=A0ABR2LDU6_9ASPA